MPLQMKDDGRAAPTHPRQAPNQTRASPTALCTVYAVRLPRSRCSSPVVNPPVQLPTRCTRSKEQWSQRRRDTSRKAYAQRTSAVALEIAVDVPDVTFASTVARKGRTL